jgi:hypothetical protein
METSFEDDMISLGLRKILGEVRFSIMPLTGVLCPNGNSTASA